MQCYLVTKDYKFYCTSATIEHFIFINKDNATAKYEELKKLAIKDATSFDWIQDDSKNSFEAYADGRYDEEHHTITIEQLETAD